MPDEQFDLRLAAPFVALAEEGRLDRAARRLGIDVTELESDLRRLELQVGAPLWERLTPVAEVTPAGARFLVEARAMVDQAAQLAAVVRPAAGRLRVHVGLNPSPLVESMLSSFAAANPDVQIELEEGSDNEAEAAVVGGRVHAALSVVGRQLPDTVAQMVVDRSPLGVVCPVDHPLAGRTSARWTDLGGRRLLFPAPGRHDAWCILVRGALHRASVSHIEMVESHPVAHPRELGPELIARRAVLVGTAGIAAQAGPDVTWVPLRPVQVLDRALGWRRDLADELTGMLVAWVASRRADAGTGPGPGRVADP